MKGLNICTLHITQTLGAIVMCDEKAGQHHSVVVKQGKTMRRPKKSGVDQCLPPTSRTALTWISDIIVWFN